MAGKYAILLTYSKLVFLKSIEVSRKINEKSDLKILIDMCKQRLTKSSTTLVESVRRYNCLPY